MTSVLLGTEMLIVFFSLLVVVRGSCPEGQVWHPETSACCIPTFNCDIESEVRLCSLSGGTDECVACGDDRTNGYVTSSLNQALHRCFNKTKNHDNCPVGDTVPIPAFKESKCAIPCRCRYEDCYYGDQCACKMARECKQNEELDPDTGNCIACPEGMHKPSAGCQPCTWIEGSTLWMKLYKEMNVTVDQDPYVVAEPKSTMIETDLSPTNPGYNTLESSSDTPVQAKESGGISMVAVIIVIAILVGVGILIAVFLIILRRKINSGDTTSRMVVCYYKLTGSGPPPTQDPEAGTAGEDGEARNVPVQEVTPMIQSSGAPAEGETNMDTLHQLESVAEETPGGDANTTTTPLIGGTVREDDETEQKTKECD